MNYICGGKGRENMTRRDLMRLFVRLFGLMILVGVVLELQLGISIFVQVARSPAGDVFHSLQADVFSRVAGYIGSLVPYAIAGICFLFWSGRVVDSASLAPGESVESADLRDVEIILVAVLGLYLLADGFAELCRSAIQGLSDLFRGRQLSVIWGMQTIFIAQASVKLILGIFLVLGRGGVVAVLHRVHAWVRKWRAWPDEAPLSEG
jgi:hypothetical protein